MDIPVAVLNRDTNNDWRRPKEPDAVLVCRNDRSKLRFPLYIVVHKDGTVRDGGAPVYKRSYDAIRAAKNDRDAIVVTLRIKTEE